MRRISEWGALLSAMLAIGCLIFWAFSLSGVLASPDTGFEVFLKPSGRYVVSERGNIWIGFNLQKPADVEPLKRKEILRIVVTRAQYGKEAEDLHLDSSEWRGPGFLVVTIGRRPFLGWLVGGSLLVPAVASAIVAAVCFLALRRDRKRRVVPKESPISKWPTTE
jgi:hypothetical protein